MKKFIEVYDNVLPKEIVNTLEDLILISSTIPLYYTDKITLESQTTFSPGFANEFYNSTINKTSSLSPLLLEVIYRFGQFTNIVIREIFQARVFVHLPSPNPGPDIEHTDLNYPHWVCLYYVNDSEGDTILFNDKGEEIQRVIPKKGRIVFFDGSIKHCSSRPSSKTRAVLNFDFQGYKFNK